MKASCRHCDIKTETEAAAATSAIDYSTDAIIQKTLRETLGDATVITVAHRLQTASFNE